MHTIIFFHYPYVMVVCIYAEWEAKTLFNIETKFDSF
jgi:hypothetical protein